MIEDLLERVIRAQIRAVGEMSPDAPIAVGSSRVRAGDVLSAWTSYVSWAAHDESEHPALALLCDTLEAQSGMLIGAVLRTAAPEAPAPAPGDGGDEVVSSPAPENEAASGPLDATET